MQCFLINLDRSRERLAAMETAFGRMGLTFTRIPAVDGRAIPPEDYARLVPEDRLWIHPLMPSEVGCFLSHRACLERIARGTAPYAAVFEDDMVFAAAAPAALSETGWIPADADIVKLETHRRDVLLEARLPGPTPAVRVARLRSKHLCTGGYIISREAARRMLAHMQTVRLPVDRLYFDPDFAVFGEFAIYQLVPAICVQSGIDSLIAADRARNAGQKSRFYKRRERFKAALRRLLSPVLRTSYSLKPHRLWTTLTSRRAWIRVPFKP